MDSSTVGKLLGSNPIAGPKENIRKGLAGSRGSVMLAISSASAEPSLFVSTAPMSGSEPGCDSLHKEEVDFLREIL